MFVWLDTSDFQYQFCIPLHFFIRKFTLLLRITEEDMWDYCGWNIFKTKLTILNLATHLRYLWKKCSVIKLSKYIQS